MFSWEVYQDWRLAGYDPAALPYNGGGMMGQPAWLRRDLRLFRSVERWWSINGKLTDTTGMPRIEDH